MKYIYRLQTRYSETAQDGIIHHSSYIPYLEEARIAYFHSLGCSINELEKEKKFCIVIDVSVKYLKPLLSEEAVAVHVWVEDFTKVRFRLGYEIFKDTTCVTQATTSHCFLNESFKPIPIPSSLHLKE